MDCQTCRRHYDAVPGLNCPACARASLHPLRLRQAGVLIDKEHLGQQVEKVVSEQDIPQRRDSKLQDVPNDAYGCATTLGRADGLAELLQARERIDTIVKHTATLRDDMIALKKEIEDRRLQRDERQRELRQAKEALGSRQNGTIPSLQRNNKERNRLHDRTFADIVAQRIHQCKRAASLAGLKQIPRPAEGGKRAMQYFVNNLLIFDIRHLNNTEPSYVNSMFQSVARLTYQVCGYLQIRLPAEIVLPFSGHPWPTIYAPASSYAKHDVLSSKKNSPLESRENSIKDSHELEKRVAGRARHLSIEKKLPRLAKENKVAYALFVEGMALLAWDIAWLCRTQGLPVAEKNWDDACDIGRNLWLLLCTQVPAASDLRRIVRNDPASAIKQARLGAAFSAPTAPTALGVFSHASARNNIEGPRPPNASTYDVTARGWDFANPVKIVDELRAALLTEMSGHDWELLDDKESEAGDNTDADETVVVDNKEKSGSGKSRAESERREVRRGTSGWTKLKNRQPAE